MKRTLRLFLVAGLFGLAGLQTSCSWGDFAEFFMGASFDTRPYRTIGLMETPREWEHIIMRDLTNKGYQVALGGSPSAFVRVSITDVDCVLVDAHHNRVYDRDSKTAKRPFSHYYEAEASLSIVEPSGVVLYTTSSTSSPKRNTWEAMRAAVDSVVSYVPAYGEYPGKYNGKGQ